MYKHFGLSDLYHLMMMVFLVANAMVDLRINREQESKKVKTHKEKN